MFRVIGHTADVGTRESKKEFSVKRTRGPGLSLCDVQKKLDDRCSFVREHSFKIVDLGKPAFPYRARRQVVDAHNEHAPVGTLKLATRTPWGFTPSKTLLIVPSLPAVSMA